LKSVEESLKEPILYCNNNLGSLINLADNAIKNQITNFVFSSSCTVYGQPDNIPVNESTPFKPSESVYGETKQISEGILERLSNNSDMSVISLRYFNPIGAHESALIGELATSTATNLVPLVTETAIKKREKLFVFGNDYNTKDGTCVRDYIHVVDIAKAHVAALQRLFQGNKTNYKVFNLGTGSGTTVLEIIHTFEQVSGIKLNYEITDRRSGDVEQIYSNSKLANEVLGWKAEKSLEEMLSSAWNWEQQLTEQNSIVEQE
ncbi:MAG: UDP-glucose 4-epimerase GalE, partial [Bacteroidia bacterium]|nr:UDP-glucose 4-epimerase GalE [Bacteroidia bacterium]